MVGFMKSALNLLGIKGKGAETSIDLSDFLAKLPEHMGYNVNFKQVESDGSGYKFEVEGDEVDSFLGDSSDMLDALAHISMRILRKSEGLSNAPASEGTEGLRVIFDAQGFRDRKTSELKEFAAAQRQKVIDSGGKPAYIPALSPSERKVVHTHLAELGEVVSESIGRGTFKRIRVRLKEDSQYRKAPESRQASEEGGEQRSGNGQGRRQRSGNRGGGGRNQHQQRGRKGGGGRHNQNRDQNFNVQSGNTYAPQDEIDDNIGNRLAPGEEPLFKVPGSKYQSEDDFK